MGDEKRTDISTLINNPVEQSTSTDMDENKINVKVPDKVPDNLSDNSKKIFIEIQKNNRISMSELSEIVGISKRKILDNINKLKQTGLLLTNMYYQLLISFGRSNTVMWFTILFSLLSLIIAVITAKYGMFMMITAFIVLYLLSIGGWHYFAAKLIGLKVIDVLRDILPYLAITLGSFSITWLLTCSIENLVFSCIAKILIASVLYVSIVRFSGSILLKESILFLMSHLRRQ